MALQPARAGGALSLAVHACTGCAAGAQAEGNVGGSGRCADHPLPRHAQVFQRQATHPWLPGMASETAERVQWCWGGLPTHSVLCLGTLGPHLLCTVRRFDAHDPAASCAHGFQAGVT
eukprot:scaffold7594_cov417-Prasinococcus_capsulatus_cf.AAC.3